MDGAYEVVITPRAEASLEEILVYLIENVSMETAERVRSKLLEVIYNLGKMPTANPVAGGIISEKESYTGAPWRYHTGSSTQSKKSSYRCWSWISTTSGEIQSPLTKVLNNPRREHS